MRVSEQFHLGVIHDGDIATAVIHGDLDADTVPKLRAAVSGLLSNGTMHITLDLKEMTFVDSSGLGAIVDTARTLRAAGGDLSLVNPRPSVRRIFQLTSLEDALRIATGNEG